MLRSYPKRLGYATIRWDDGRVIEMDAFLCGHCQKMTHVHPRQRPEDLGGLCKVCMQLICAECQGNMEKGHGCMTWEAKMEKMEARDRFLRSVGLLEEVSKNCWIRPG
jgi:hypothetical protein